MSGIPVGTGDARVGVHKPAGCAERAEGLRACMLRGGGVARRG